MTFKDYRKEAKDVDEDAPTNNIGSGKVDITPTKKKKRNVFAGHDIFEIDSDMFSKIKREKITFERMGKLFDVTQGIGADIHNFNRTHPYNGIVLQDQGSGMMIFFKRKRDKPVESK